MWPKKLSNKNGFTLVEIIVVLITLAILAAFTIPTYLGYVKNSKVLMDESTLGLLNRTTQAYRTSHHQSDPTTDPFSGNSGSETSGNLLALLVKGDYLSATDVIPKTAGTNFAWTPGAIGKGRWSLALANQTEYATVKEARAAGFEFEDNNDGKDYTITHYKGSSLDLVIPGEIAGKKVTRIGNNDDGKAFHPFQNKGLSSVSIPNTVTFIAAYAFQGNELTSLTIPNSVSIIGDYAFDTNKLTEVTISASANNIGNHAFKGNQLIEVIIPTSVTRIGGEAFKGNQLTKVTLLGTPETIASNAFDNNGLATIKTEGVYKLIDNEWVKQ